MSYTHPGKLLPAIAARELGVGLVKCQSLLDIGGGTGVVGEDDWHAAGITSFTVVDAWDGYDWSPYKDRIRFCRLPGQCALNYFGAESFDIVQCCECIEHMPKEEGRQVLLDMKELARYLVLITCPKGYLHQDPGAEEAKNEPWRDNPYQQHLCGWEPDELEEIGYTVEFNGGDPPYFAGAQLVSYYLRHQQIR